MEFQSNYSIINCARVQHCIQFISCRLSKTLTHPEPRRRQTPLCTSGIKAKRELPNNIFFATNKAFRIDLPAPICCYIETQQEVCRNKNCQDFFFRVNKHVKHRYPALLSENIKCLKLFLYIFRTSICRKFLTIQV